MPDRRLTVMHLDGERGLRGGERQLLYLAEELRRRGHQNIIVCRQGEALDRESASMGFERLHLPFLFEWDPLSAWQLRKRALQVSSPVLHAHTSHTAALAFMAAEGAHLPRLVHRRVDFSVAPGMDFAVKYKRADRVLTVSEAIRRQMLSAGLTPEAVVTIPDAFPSERVLVAPRGHSAILAERGAIAQEFDCAAGAMWVGNLAALVPHKDHSTLLKAMPEVLRAFPETYLLIGGEGPLLESLSQEARSLGIDSRVRFLGQVRDTAAFLGALDLFVLTSWGEGFGSVLLEAMAHAVPIVATSAGGIPEAVAHNESGLLMPPRDFANIATAMLRILKDASLGARLAQKGLERVRGFSLGAMGQKTEQAYLEVSKS